MRRGILYWSFVLIAGFAGILLFPSCNDDDGPRPSEPVALLAPVLVSPIDGMAFNNYPRTTVLDWEPVKGADSYVVEIQFRGFDEWYDFQTVEPTETTYTFTFVGAQPGRWRVRAKRDDGDTGPWSDYWEFYYTV